MKRRRNRQNFKDVKEVLIYLQHFSELSKLGELITSTKETSFLPHIDGFIDKTGRPKGYNKWTLLKLLALQLYVPLYTKIIGTRYAEWNFIDLFSGSGVGKLEDTNIILPGSPIIGLSFASVPFTRAFFTDTNYQKIGRLVKRVNLLKELSIDDHYREVILSDLSNVEIMIKAQDANKAVYEIFDHLEDLHVKLYKEKGKGVHNLIFIDPYGMEFYCNSLKRILSSKIRNDLFILFNSYGAGLQAYEHIHHGRSAKALYRHLGENWLEYVKKSLDFQGSELNKVTRNMLSNILGQYYENIIRSTGKYITVRISLPLELKNQQFDLIFAVHKTKSGNKFVRGIEYIKELLERTNYEFIDRLKDAIIKKKLPGLLRYILENPENALRQYSLYRRYGVKTDLRNRSEKLDKWFDKK